MFTYKEIIIFILIQIMIAWVQNKGCKWIDNGIDIISDFFTSITNNSQIYVDDEEIFQKRIAQSKRRT